MMHDMRITEALIAEHTIFLGVFNQIERALPSLVTPAEVRTMASMVEGLLEGHAKTEANLAYLVLDHVLEHNGELKRMHQDHHEIDDRLRNVHKAKSCAEARRLLTLAIGASREHFQGEERSVFPMLEKALGEETLTALGETWMQRQAVTANGA
jgi:hemerythrin-like domain-containing protein